MVRPVSYPDHGNEICFQIEDGSYWFAHRQECIIEIMRRFPPGGTVYDIGGGNGFVSAGLQAAGFETVLVEPGTGALNARKRGVKNVVQSTLEDAGFRENSMHAVGVFDVLEHIDDETGFLMCIAKLLHPGGRFYCTVPAISGLWSDEDEFAGHHRRYSARRLRDAVERHGLEVEFLSSFFSFLVAPVYLLRTLPFRLRGKKELTALRMQEIKADHSLPAGFSTIIAAFNAWELARLKTGRGLPFGSSLLCVARQRSV